MAGQIEMASAVRNSNGVAPSECELQEAQKLEVKVNAAVQRVLIYRVGSLGDMVVALPCFHLIARAFSGAERLLLNDEHAYAGGTPAMQVLEGSGLVSGEIRYAGATRRGVEMLKLLGRIRRFQPHVIVYLMPIRSRWRLRRDRLFFWLAGVRRIVGMPNAECSSHLFNAVSGLYESEASRLARCISELGDARLEERDSWELRLTGEELSSAITALAPLQGRRLIAVSLGTKWQPNDWGTERWRELLDRLAIKEGRRALVFLGSEGDAARSDLAAEGWRRRGRDAMNLCGKLSPRQSAAVMAQCEIFLGHDSGPMHLSAAVQTPCVTVFSGKNLPGIWFPSGRRNRVLYHEVDCMGCGLTECVVERKKCIYSIQAAEVLEAVDGVLGSGLEPEPVLAKANHAD